MPEALASVEDLIQELVKAWKRMLLYPRDHPERRGALAKPFALLRPMLATSGGLALGVARDGLLSQDLKMSSSGVQELAHALYFRDVALIRFTEGLDLEELESFLLCLRASARLVAGAERSFGEELAEIGISHVEVEPVDYTSVVVADGPAVASDATSLWERILRAKLGGETAADGGDSSLRQVLEWIRRSLSSAGGPEVEEHDPVTTLATAVEEHLGSRSGGGRARIRQVGELLAALPEALRDRFLDMALSRLSSAGGDSRALEGLAASAPAADMLASLRRLRDAGESFSERALRLIQELAADGSERAEPSRSMSPAELQAAMATLLADDRPQSEDDDFILALPQTPRATLTWPAELEESRASLTPGALTQSVLTVVLTLLTERRFDEHAAEATARRLEAIFGELILSGRVFAAVALVQHLKELQGGEPSPTSTAVNRLLERLAGESTAETVLQVLRLGEEAQTSQLTFLVEVLGGAIGRHLLIAMCETEDRSDRRHLFDFVRHLGARLVPDARDLLRDGRWYVVRNMLNLLHSAGDLSAIPAVRGSARHDDPRVRLEAAKFLIQHDQSLPSTLLESLLHDEDPTVSDAVIVAVGRARLVAAVEPLLAIATQRDPFGRTKDLRLKAVHCLGEVGDPEALAPLRGYFGIWGYGVDERRGAFASLAGYPAAARRPYVDKGLTSRDPQIREICKRLLAAEAEGE